MRSTINSVIPKLPSRNLQATKSFYEKLGFRQTGGDYPDYLMMQLEKVELHFFLFPDLDATQNYGMCYIRVTGIDDLYNDMKKTRIPFPDSRALKQKPWGQKEFSIIDEDTNLLTFGEGMK